jgi:lactate permease
VHELPFSIWYWLLALSPIIVVLILMIGFRWGGSKAGPLGWLTAAAVSVGFFRGTGRLLAYSQGRAVLLTVYVLYIIWMALLLYNVVNEAGAIGVIGRAIARLTGDRAIQLLILGWVFSAFLQGIAGFGVPIAVVAPLLIGMGFDPVTSVAATAIGHSWSVTFGDIASSFQALIAATSLEGLGLAHWSALFLGITCFGCAVAAAYVHGGFRAIGHTLPAIMVIGVTMSGTQYLLATNSLWNIAGFMAGLVGLAAATVVTRLGMYRAVSATGTSAGECDRWSLPLALAPYLLLIVLVAMAELCAPLHDLINRVTIRAQFPELCTGYGWVTHAGPGRAISVFGHPGALLAYTSVVAYLLYRRIGHYGEGVLQRIKANTVRSAVPSSIGIASLVGMALIMDHSGMTYLLAEGIHRRARAAFPLFSPLIGVLGAFMTGSNTNSNVIFAPLQQQAAELIGISAFVVLSAQTTGGSVGSMLAPAKIIVGCSTAGLSGREGQVLKKTLVPGLLISAFVGLATWLVIYLA